MTILVFGAALALICQAQEAIVFEECSRVHQSPHPAPDLMARIIDRATGDLYCASLSALSWPTPCSAEKGCRTAPPRRQTSWFTRILLGARKSRVAAPGACIVCSADFARLPGGRDDQAHAGNSRASSLRRCAPQKAGMREGGNRYVVSDVQAFLGLGH